MAAGLLAVLGGGALLWLFLFEGAAEREAEQAFRELLKGLSDRRTAAATRAALSIPDHAAALADPARLLEAAEVFSSGRLRAAGEERLGVARTFWRQVLLLGRHEGRTSAALAARRHEHLAAPPRREPPGEIHVPREDEPGPRMRAALEELAVELFRSPAPPRGELGPLLWDRANLEALGGLGSEALESYRRLRYEEVRDHRELEGRQGYLVAKAELRGRLRRLLSPPAAPVNEAGEETREEAPVPLPVAGDAELAAFAAEDGGRNAPLLEGIDLLHGGDPVEALPAFERFLSAAAGGGARPPPADASRLLQLARFLRAQACLEAARREFRAARRITLAPATPVVAARGALELRLARLLASLGLREELEEIASGLGRGDREIRELLAALGEASWGDRDRGRRRLEERLAVQQDLPDRRAWQALARGVLPRAPEAILDAGLICDELGDLPRLERLVERLEFLMEEEPDEAYLAFLRALLQLRRGEVVEGRAVLDRLLERPSLPPGLSRNLVARVMEGAEEAAERLTRARSLLFEAEKDLEELHSARKEIDSVLALRSSMALWAARVEGESVDPPRRKALRESRAGLLEEVLEGLGAVDRVSFALERSWIGLRNAMVRGFRDSARQGRLDDALERLRDLEALLGAKGPRLFPEEEASLLLERGALRQGALEMEQAVEDFRRAGELFEVAARLEEDSAERGGADAESLRRRAAEAFERAGDAAGVTRAVGPHEGSTRDVVLLGLHARALLEQGELERAREVLERVLALGTLAARTAEDPEEPPESVGAPLPPLDPVQLEARVSLAEALLRMARLHRFSDPARDLLDGEAREALLLACEEVGNRSAIWRRAMYLRALQLERQAEEARREEAGARTAAGLASEAAELYRRLLGVAQLPDGPEWIGRAHLSLARLELEQERPEEARRWLDRLAGADLEKLGRQLLPRVRAELSDLVRGAAFLRGDLAHRSGDLAEAARLYAEAVERHDGSPLALWGHLQLGGIYESQGLPGDALHEYRRGRGLLEGLPERMRAPGGRALWERLFDAGISRQSRAPGR